MIDFILFFFVLCVFAGGFWCGKTYGSGKKMAKSAWDGLGKMFS